MEPPLISIIVPYYKRGPVFDVCLQSVLAQNYLRREVIIIDNGSADGLAARIPAGRSEVRLISLEENRGACAARNAGIQAAAGQILVFLDDDVSFESPSALTNIRAVLDAHPRSAVLAFQVCDPHTGAVRKREWCHARPCGEFAEREFETNWFGEGACAIRRPVVDTCGGYYDRFFYGAEGHDLILRILDHGFRILHTPQIRVNHWASEEGRSAGRQLYYFTRNYVWMGYKDYPFWRGVAFTVLKVLMMLYFAWRTSGYGPFLRGLWDGVRGLRAVRHDRTPVRPETCRYLAEQEKWRPGLLARLARHREEPQI